MLNIVFRADASHTIGIGHVMRCLTLASELEKTVSSNIFFFVRKSEGNASLLILSKGYQLIEMETARSVESPNLKHGEWLGKTQDADAEEFLEKINNLGIDKIDYLIVDHYGIDHKWQKLVRHATETLLVIDDLGDRKHICDILLDQTFKCPSNKYCNLVPKWCKKLLGTQYALLRDEFRNKGNSSTNNEQAGITNILVMFGGTDPANLTQQALNILLQREDSLQITVVLSSSAKHLNDIQLFSKSESRISLHVSPPNIADIMRNANLAIGAAGTSSWERCALGLPAIVVIQADNQREIAKKLEIEGVITSMEKEEIEIHLNEQFDEWISKQPSIDSIKKKCIAICDAKGAERVSKALLDF